MNYLEGRRIVVTGAGRGIGAAIAQLAASEGASVVVNDLGVQIDGSGQDSGPAQEVAERITAAGGVAVPHLADVTDTDQATDLIDTAIREFGGLDVLINVAGILRDRMVFNMTPEEWDGVLRVHLRGTFNTSRAAARYWREQRRLDGHYRLINTTSVAGLYGAPGQPNYAAAKLGIVGFTYSCANALMKYGVTANVLSPGAQTRMVATIPDPTRMRGGDGDEAPRPPMGAEQVAPAVIYVASVQSDWMTGQVFGAQGTTISLYNRPRIARQITTTGEIWDVADVFAKFEATFRPAVDDTENFYEVVAKMETAKALATPVVTSLDTVAAS
jgi:NAD(P)-dependent dehydrogenase (short-subunit alcohol dehydrogenase family)